MGLAQARPNNGCCSEGVATPTRRAVAPRYNCTCIMVAVVKRIEMANKPLEIGMYVILTTAK